MKNRIKFECEFRSRPKKGELAQAQWDKEYGGESTLQGCGHKWVKMMIDEEVAAMFGPDGRREVCPVCGKTRSVCFETPGLMRAFNDAMFGRREK